MALTLIKPARDENSLEHLAVLNTFSDVERHTQRPFITFAGNGQFFPALHERAISGLPGGA